MCIKDLNILEANTTSNREDPIILQATFCPLEMKKNVY